MTAAVIKMPMRRVRPCDNFVAGSRAGFCVCTFGRHAHKPQPLVSCSQCNGKFRARPGVVTGYSHCADHRRAP